ncbi:MAG TPA: hypothetical protein VK944_05050 [Candidatus Limnocylindria bacterium]|nr:hypothetical protein [Candidatus Limnocylindria bacterium]
MKNRSRKWRSWQKAVFAASLLVIFGTVVFSVSPERLAWQGPLVMGTLAMPTPNPAKVVLLEQRAQSDSLISLMGFLSVAGILALSGKWLFVKPSPKKVREKLVYPLVFP